MQLKYELEKIKNELTSLQKNWIRKNKESSDKIVNFRNELKERAAVMAAIEESYTSYCNLVTSLQHICGPDNDLQTTTIDEPETISPVNSQIQDCIRQAKEAEAERITRIRSEHKIQSNRIQRKSKDIYLALKEEKIKVDNYEVVLQTKINEREEQLTMQIKADGMGFGL